MNIIINMDSIPSANLNVVNTGVYWSASYEEGRILFNDARISDDGADGADGDGKSVSSDHRMVWIKTQF